MNPKIREALEVAYIAGKFGPDYAFDYRSGVTTGEIDSALERAKSYLGILLDTAALDDDGWIPVSERLPEGFDVLTFNGEFISIECPPLSEDITHWRPLPPPPKDKSDG